MKARIVSYGVLWLILASMSAPPAFGQAACSCLGSGDDKIDSNGRNDEVMSVGSAPIGHGLPSARCRLRSYEPDLMEAALHVAGPASAPATDISLPMSVVWNSIPGSLTLTVGVQDAAVFDWLAAHGTLSTPPLDLCPCSYRVFVGSVGSGRHDYRSPKVLRSAPLPGAMTRQFTLTGLSSQPGGNWSVEFRASSKKHGGTRKHGAGARISCDISAP